MLLEVAHAGGHSLEVATPDEEYFSVLRRRADVQASCGKSVVNRHKRTCHTGHVAIPICLRFELPTLPPTPFSAA